MSASKSRGFYIGVDIAFGNRPFIGKLKPFKHEF